MIETEIKLMKIVEQEIKDIEDFQFNLVNSFIRTQLCCETLNRFSKVRTEVLDLDVKRSKYVEILKILESLSQKECKK